MEVRLKLIQSKIVIGRNAYKKGDIFTVNEQYANIFVSSGVAERAKENARLSETDDQRKIRLEAANKAAADKSTKEAVDRKAASEKSAAEKAAADKSKSSSGQKKTDDNKPSPTAVGATVTQQLGATTTQPLGNKE